MDWLWSKWSSKKDDPVSKLDPGLKEFLHQQQPAKYETTPPPAPEPIEEPKKKEASLPDTNRLYDDRPLPRESLFQDGRYAHLWKTYTPAAEIETTTDATQRLHQEYINRRQLIHDAALENCALEDEALRNCFDVGDWKQRFMARATLCSKDDKAFNRCYQLQAKFLVALGYMAPGASTTAEQDERIQMHADKLYHRMLDYEKAVEEAKENQDPIPELGSVFDPNRPAPDPSVLRVPKTAEKAMKRPLSEMPPHEQELAVVAWRAEMNQTKGMAQDLTTYMQKQHENKMQRQTALSRIFGPTVAKFIVDDTERPRVSAEVESKK